jgi:ATP-dependent Clp protease, protease subunit
MTRLQNLIKQALQNTAAGNGGFRAEGDTLYLYDVIGDWGVTAESFVKALQGMSAETVHIRIDSPGGDVFAGRAMATAIAQYKGKVIVHIDGWAASAATYVAIAADEVEITEGGFFMIHNAWTMVIGNKQDLIDMAAIMEKIDASIIADYVRKTGKTEAQVVEWMNAETWFSAQEAMDNGFVDRIFESGKGKTKSNRGWNPAAYKNAPAALTAQPEQDFETIAANNKRRLQLVEIG